MILFFLKKIFNKSFSRDGTKINNKVYLDKIVKLR